MYWPLRQEALLNAWGLCILVRNECQFMIQKQKKISEFEASRSVDDFKMGVLGNCVEHFRSVVYVSEISGRGKG